MQNFNTKCELQIPVQVQVDDWGQQCTLKRKKTYKKELRKWRRGGNGEVEEQEDRDNR